MAPAPLLSLNFLTGFVEFRELRTQKLLPRKMKYIFVGQKFENSKPLHSVAISMRISSWATVMAVTRFGILLWLPIGISEILCTVRMPVTYLLARILR